MELNNHLLLVILTTSLVQFPHGKFPIQTSVQPFAEWLLLPQGSIQNLRSPVENDKFVKEDGQQPEKFLIFQISSNKIEVGKYLHPDIAGQQNIGLPIQSTILAACYPSPFQSNQ